MLTFGLIYGKCSDTRETNSLGFAVLELGKFCVEFSNPFFTFLEV